MNLVHHSPEEMLSLTIFVKVSWNKCCFPSGLQRLSSLVIAFHRLKHTPQGKTDLAGSPGRRPTRPTEQIQAYLGKI